VMRAESQRGVRRLDHAGFSPTPISSTSEPATALSALSCRQRRNIRCLTERPRRRLTTRTSAGHALGHRVAPDPHGAEHLIEPAC
jgi:hypothetical protein